MSSPSATEASEPPSTIDPASPPALLGFGGITTGDLEALTGGNPALRTLLNPPFVPGPETVGGLPILLALLGAFLALQRGIGRGLGHVPMAPQTTTQTTHDPI